MTTQHGGQNTNRQQLSPGNIGLVKLALLLRNEGHRALNGGSSFTLTTCVLDQLNTECRRHSLSLNDDPDAEIPKPRMSSVFLRGRQKQQQEINKAKEEWNYHIQFIKDFMQFTPSLKLICSTGALMSVISLHRFGNLTSLNLQKVPINMVEGLQVLRGMLTSLTAYKGVSRVKDLLELCGKDMSVPSTWPVLKFLSLAFNSLTDLDGSLGLLPYVEIIDLSHNSLQTCGTFLEDLNDVRLISLAYNSLSQIPTVSLTARACLTCLVLRGNNLDNLTGIEELKALQQLDLGENCLSAHRILNSLGALVNLHQLQLDGNPLSYHRLHRQLTASSLAHQVVNIMFELDKKKLTVSEISFFSEMKAKFERMVMASLPHGRVLARRRSLDRGFEDSISSISGNDAKSDSAEISSPKRRRKSRHKRLRARDTPIMDRDFSGKIYYSQDIRPGSAPYSRDLEKQWKDRQEEAQRTKKEIEELRKHYGQNWLLAIEDKNIFIKKKTNKELRSASSLTDKEKTGPVSGDLTDVSKDSKTSKVLDLKTDMRIAEKEGQTDTVGINSSDASKPVMFAIARRAACLPADLIKEENNGRVGSVQIPDLSSSHAVTSSGSAIINSSLTTGNNLSNSSPESRSCPVLNPAPKVKKDQNVSEIGVNEIRDHLNTNQDYIDSISEVKNQPLLPNQVTEKQDLAVLLEYSETIESEDQSSTQKSVTPTKNGISREIKMGTDKSTHVSAIEEDEVLEPMFVKCPLRGNEMIILSLTATYLVEKDVGGVVMERLELSSLSSLEWKKINGGVGNGDDRSGLGMEKGPWGLGGVAPGEAGVSVEDRIVGEREEESLQLDLKFDYVRKDKQSRCYVVDIADEKQIMGHLQPFLEAREGAVNGGSSSVMQCLKCNKTFKKGEPQHQTKKLPKSGSSKDLSELTSQDTSLCPRCGSNIIIEVSQSQAAITTASPSRQALLESPKLPARRFSGLTKRFIKSVKKGSDETRNSQPTLPTSDVGRDRSSAFKAPSKITRNVLLASCEQREVSGDELVCVEDYFSIDSMDDITTSSQLARLTSSLQGDLSTQGTKAFVRKTSLPVSYRTNIVSQAHSEYKDIIEQSKSGQFSGSKYFYPSSYPTRLFNKEDKALGRKNYFEEGKDEDTEVKEKVNAVTTSGTFVHTSLAAMTNIVNTLISEGKHQEELERSSEEPGGGSGNRHVISNHIHGKDNCRQVSIGVPITTPYHQTSTSSSFLDKSYPDLGFRYSASMSSTYPVSATNVEFSESKPPFFSSSSSQPVDFHVGTPRQNSETNSRTPSGVTGSSLLSNRRPSVLKTSVSSPEAGVCTSSEIVVDAVENVPSAAVTADAESSDACAKDQSSIYDHSAALPKDIFSEQKLVPAVDLPDDTGSFCENAIASAGLATTWEEASRKLSFLTHGKVAAEDEQETSDEPSDEDSVPNYGFYHLNHHLTLHMMMTLFKGEEEFLCKIQCPVVQYIIEEPYEAIFIMSSHRFYILKVTSEDHSQSPDQWLHCVEIQPIPELRYIDMGLGGQSLRLEFMTDCSSFTLITQNRDKTVQFVDVLHNNLAKYAVRHCVTSRVVVNEDIDQATIDNLDLDVVSVVMHGQKLLYYCMGLVERENNKKHLVSLVVTSCDICLVSTNHQWPQPRLQAPITIETVGKQFTVLDRQRVTNVASLEICEVTCRKIKLEFFREGEVASKCWRITLASRQTAVDFINALKQPWTREFEIEMEITYGEVDF